MKILYFQPDGLNSMCIKKKKMYRFDPKYRNRVPNKAIPLPAAGVKAAYWGYSTEKIL